MGLRLYGPRVARSEVLNSFSTAIVDDETSILLVFQALHSHVGRVIFYIIAQQSGKYSRIERLAMFIYPSQPCLSWKVWRNLILLP